MNNTQLYLSIGIPTVTVILAWLSSRADITRLDSKIDKLAETLRGEMMAIRGEMITLRRDFNADMIAFRKEIHGDLIMLYERVVKVEVQQGLDS